MSSYTMVIVRQVTLSAKTQIWCVVIAVVTTMVMEVAALNGPNVCMVKQKYNITKRVKYRAPMSVRTYEWCMAIPPRCSKWNTEMRDLTRLETEERTAEVAVCCPGYKMKDVSCVPICPNGRHGHSCSQECPQNKWGPNCVNDCKPCFDHGACSPITGDCLCQEGWQGESCESRMSSSTSTTTTTARVEELLTQNPATKITQPSSAMLSTTTKALVETTSFSTKNRTAITTTSQTTTFEQTKLAVTAFQETATTMTSAVDVTPSLKNETKVENNKTNVVSTFSDISTIKYNLSTNLPANNFTATKISRTTSTDIPEVQTAKALETTTWKEGTKQAIVTSTSTEYGITRIKSPNDQSYATTLVESTTTTELYYPTTGFNNITLGTFKTKDFRPIKVTTQVLNYDRTKSNLPTRIYPKEVHVEIKTTPVRIVKTSGTNYAITQKTTAISVPTEIPLVTTHATAITEGTTKLEITRRPDATFRYFPTTVKFKPKEIWIRPAQKGQEPFGEAKKTNHDLHIRHRVSTNKESAPNTTPKTIIVSIIPTSVSYATFKKIALSTASVLSTKINATFKPYNNSADQGFTRPMSVLTTHAPLTSTINTASTSTVVHATKLSTSESINASKSNEHFSKIAKSLPGLPISRATLRNKSKSPSGTNSMETVIQNLNTSISVTPTVSLTNFTKTPTRKPYVATNKQATIHLEKVTKPVKKLVTAKPVGKNDSTIVDKEKTNATKIFNITNDQTNKMTTENPDDEGTFHILTEPEHITAVMEGKGKETSSVDLISVISIAGGIMMVVITVAVIIVMVERCKRPRYEDVRKMNDIHMQVMIDSNDIPPPYVRSIFHTPLPEPPTSDKCHYQPISTLDRNLKQFMRPVVVQTISPIMLENFRGILECHYDHLPRRNHEFEVRAKNCSIPPSGEDLDELARLRPCSIAESTIDALKCEAKLDVIDSTTSEPLYAEIPCWRPPSEHAIEVMNYNGEAVTEL